MSQPPDVRSQGHPKGLYLLFGVEAWERFSYYGMRALLVLYMVKVLQFSTEKAGSIYGMYTGLVYLTPLFGGYLADRYLGARKSIFIGGLLMALGHFAMAFPPLPFFYAALILLILGNGFFKPNISTVVGKLYEKDDPRRDGGFTIFYMGINLGAFFSPLVCSTLGESVGWHYGFGAAGVGMLLGLVMYMIWGKRFLGDKGMEPTRPHLNADGTSSDEPLTREEKERIAVIFIMSFFVIFFWAAFEQAGSSMTLFADRSTDRSISFIQVAHPIAWFRSIMPTVPWQFPAGWFQAVNPLLIVLLAPLFSRMWLDLARRGKEPSTPVKFVFGLGLLAVGFVVMIAAAAMYVDHGPVSFFWLFAAYLLHTLGELCLSPVGLSMVTKLAPLKFASLMMGIWLGASFLANLVGGLFAGNYDTMNPVAFFAIPVATAGTAALLLLLLVKPLKRMMHGTR